MKTTVMTDFDECDENDVVECEWCDRKVPKDMATDNDNANAWNDQNGHLSVTGL